MLALDKVDPGFDRQKPGADDLRLLSTTGEQRWATTGFNSGGSVGGVHRVAVDRQRERIYVAESVADRIDAYSFEGQKLWRIEQVEADADFHLLAIACVPRTGGAWAARLGGGLRSISASGEAGRAILMRTCNVSVDRDWGDVWVADDQVVLKLDGAGKVLQRLADPKTPQALVAHGIPRSASRGRSRLVCQVALQWMRGWAACQVLLACAHGGH